MFFIWYFATSDPDGVFGFHQFARSFPWIKFSWMSKPASRPNHPQSNNVFFYHSLLKTSLSDNVFHHCWKHYLCQTMFSKPCFLPPFTVIIDINIICISLNFKLTWIILLVYRRKESKKWAFKLPKSALMGLLYIGNQFGFAWSSNITQRVRNMGQRLGGANGENPNRREKMGTGHRKGRWRKTITK